MKDALNGKNSRRGSGTLEILIAFAVLVLAITAGISLAFGNQGLVVDTELDHQAFYKATRELEGIRAAAVSDFDSVSSSVATILTAGEGVYNNIYTRKIDVLDISPCAKQATSRISWQVDALRPQEVEFSTLITSTSTLVTHGSDCIASPPSDDWDNPDDAGSIDLDPSGNQGTDVDVVKINGDRIAFMTSKFSSLGEGDFWSVTVNNPADPQILNAGGLNTGPGLNALDVADGYAFVANDDDEEPLQVIDVSTPSVPSLVATSTLVGATSTASSIHYHDQRVYVGTLENSDGPEFHVFDVSTPSAPGHLGSYEVGADVNEIAVDGGFAYLATSDNNAELTVLDVSSPASIGSEGFFNAAGSMDGTSLYLLGSRLYLGLERAPAAQSDFYILDVGTPALPDELGSKNLNMKPNTEVAGITVAGKFAFLGSTTPNAGFQVWIIENPAAITAPSPCNLYNYSEKVTGIDYMDDHVYVSNESNDALRVIWDDPLAVCSP